MSLKTCLVAALHSGLLRLLSVLICVFCSGFLNVESSSVVKAGNQGGNLLLFLTSVNILTPGGPRVDQPLHQSSSLQIYIIIF